VDGASETDAAAFVSLGAAAAAIAHTKTGTAEARPSERIFRLLAAPSIR
jgi:hypothetical protein